MQASVDKERISKIHHIRIGDKKPPRPRGKRTWKSYRNYQYTKEVC